MATSHVLDTVVLQAFGFGHRRGIEILLEALGVENAGFPREVYNADETFLPLHRRDETLSELARGLRYAERQLTTRPAGEAEHFRRWLEHAVQLHEHLRQGGLVINPLRIEELPRREALRSAYGIGRGEAACLTLAERLGAVAVFVSADEAACEVAEDLGIQIITIKGALESWTNVHRPALSLFNELIAGMRSARYDPGEDFVLDLRSDLGGGEIEE